MYNKIANQYATADQFGSISKSHQVAINQIKSHHLGLKPHYKVLDFGVGNGVFLNKLKAHMPQADLSGIDISSEMLVQAKKRLDFHAIEGNVCEASHYFPFHSQDLVLAHFINAYIPINTLFKEASLLTRATGYFSLITTTYESFPSAQQQLADFITKETLLSKVVGHYYKAMVRNSTVASGVDDLFRAFNQHEFTIVEHKRLKIPICLNNIDELAQFGIEGTWFLNSISMRMLPKNFLLQRLKHFFGQIFTFPYHDEHVIDILLAKK